MPAPKPPALPPPASPPAAPPSAAEFKPVVPLWAQEPPEPPQGRLVPGSQFHEEEWVMAARMLAQGSTFLQVARAMGCSRTTLWLAYHGSEAFRVRVWWERKALDREAEVRLRSLRSMVAQQIERLVSLGDSATIRWAADRLGLMARFDDDDREPGALREANPQTDDVVQGVLGRPEGPGPKGCVPWTLAPDNDVPDLREPEPARRGRFRREA